jgi:hypothetical protein
LWHPKHGAAAAAAAACRYQDVNVSIKDVDGLQLALNSSNAYTAKAAVRLLPQWHLQPHQARQLLLTAAANKHAGQLLDHVLLCDKVQQHIDAATSEAVVELLLAHDLATQDSITGDMIMVLRPEFTTVASVLPAAAQLARDIVARLLLAVLQQRRFDVGSVASIVADWQEALHYLTSGQIESMLLAALQQDSKQRTQCVRGLCKLPGAAALSSTAVSKLLWAALQLRDQGCSEAVISLCKLPGAAALSSTAVSKLLWAALRLQDRGCSEAVISLCKLPAVADISPREMVRVLDKLCSLCSTGAASSTGHYREAVCSLHRTQGDRYQSAASVAEMIAAAVECGARFAKDELCNLPTARRSAV